MPVNKPLRIGTRSSALARWQADWVATEINRQGVEVEMVHISTQGDVKTGPLGEIGGQGLFTKEIQRALLAGEIDLAVHSLKDLPTDPIAGLMLGAVPKRESPFDVLISPENLSLEDLPKKSRIGTGSMRRGAQLLHARPDLQIEDIRGNVDSRLRKLDEGLFDAIVLAESGLHRLGFDDRIQQILPASLMLPAVGQGALALEIRSEDQSTLETISSLNHPATQSCVTAERSLLATLRGGCMAPVGALSKIDEQNTLHLKGVVLSQDGAERITASASGGPVQAEEIGVEVAEKLHALGASKLIAASRNS